MDFVKFTVVAALDDDRNIADIEWYLNARLWRPQMSKIQCKRCGSQYIIRTQQREITEKQLPQENGWILLHEMTHKTVRLVCVDCDAMYDGKWEGVYGRPEFEELFEEVEND